jgi:hypothetical protein
MSDFLINMAAHMEGLDDAQIAQVEAAIPVAQKMIDHIVANQTLFETLLADWKVVGPAVQIVIDAIAKRQKTS